MTELLDHDALVRGCDWRRDDTASLTLYSPALQRDVLIELHVPTDNVIPESFVAVVNDFLNVPTEDAALLAEMLWCDAQHAFEVVDYGFEPRTGETLSQTAQRELGVTNAAEALAQSTLRYFSVYEQELSSRYGTLVFDCPWSGLINAVVRNGRIIDVYENGVHLGWYEPGGKYAETPSYRTRR